MLSGLFENNPPAQNIYNMNIQNIYPGGAPGNMTGGPGSVNSMPSQQSNDSSIPFSTGNSQIRPPSTLAGSSPFQTATPSQVSSVGSVNPINWQGAAPANSAGNSSIGSLDAFGVPLLSDQSAFVSANADFNSQTGPSPTVTQFQQQNLDNNRPSPPLSPETMRLFGSVVQDLNAVPNANGSLQFGQGPSQEGSLLGSVQASPQASSTGTRPDSALADSFAGSQAETNWGSRPGSVLGSQASSQASLRPGSVLGSQGSVQSLAGAPPPPETELAGPQFGITEESQLFEDAQNEDNLSGTFPDLNIPSALARDVLLQIFNTKTVVQNKSLPIEERTINEIDNMLEKNMNLSRSGVRFLNDRLNYRYWALIMYFGGEYFKDKEFLTSIQDMKKSMKSLVENMINLQNTRSDTESTSAKPDRAFLKDIFFSSDDEFRALRGKVYPSQIPTKKLGTPTGKSPVKPRLSPVQQFQNFLTPRKPQQGAAGTKGGKGLKHTGLKTVKQIISRTENLIQAANLGNKSPEVRNELDTLLSVLIDRKEVRPQFRTNLMKRLF